MTGSRVRVAYTKWGGSAHWTQTCDLLGSDEHGTWCAVPVGRAMTRPGVTVTATRDAVLLLPHDAPFTALFYLDAPARDDELMVYVDISTTPRWRASEVTMVDLDLDVVQLGDGSVFVDDEDEFAEHRVRYGYPPEVVAMAESSCADVLGRILAGCEPFGPAPGLWGERFRRLAAGRSGLTATSDGQPCSIRHGWE